MREGPWQAGRQEAWTGRCAPCRLCQGARPSIFELLGKPLTWFKHNDLLSCVVSEICLDAVGGLERRGPD